ncbi:MAG: ATP-binding protein [Erysipelotrichaceae bacterium]
MDKYLKRCIDTRLKDKLDSSGAVWIKGPKWCGKSTTAEQIAKSAVYMQSRKERDQNIALAKNAPELLLAGETPKLIDEWQIIPFIWDDIRFEIDKRAAFGQFILTGSASPLNNEEQQTIQHSGVGRISTIVMRPMSLYESLDSNGAISLNSLFSGEKVEPAVCDKKLIDYAQYACRGGWPKSIGVSEKVSIEIVRNYYDGLVENDIKSVDGVSRDIDKVKAFMRSYARNISTECSIQTIVEDIKAWSPNLRSKTTIRTSPTRHFIDPSIACRAIGADKEDLINDLKTFGLIFEDMAIRDLKIYADKLGGDVYHYRDKNGLEADAIIHLENGKWAAFEVKLHDSDRIEEGAQHLLKLASLIDEQKMKRPDFLMVITATEYAYQREDGVWIVPLACLKD